MTTRAADRIPSTASLRVEQELPDVVLLDVGLPDLDGFEVLRQIRAFSDVPVIMLTARDDTWTRSASRSVSFRRVSSSSVGPLVIRPSTIVVDLCLSEPARRRAYSARSKTSMIVRAG